MRKSFTRARSYGIDQHNRWYLRC